MACKDCDDIQEGIKIKQTPQVVRIKSTGKAYYRYKNANIEMQGCDKHLREIFNILNEAQRDENT